MYCRKCKYDLQGIVSGACPECGRAFDPSDPRTWEPVPSLPKTCLAILVSVFGLLVATQLALGLVRPLLPVAVADLDWLLAALAPLGAFAAGWYADRRAALLAFGGLCSFVIVLTFHVRGVADGWSFVANAPAVLQSSIWIGAALVLMFGSWFVGRLSWDLHVRLERLRRELATRGVRRSRRWPRPRTVLVIAAVALAAFVGRSVYETWRVLNGSATWVVDYQDEIHARRLEAAGVMGAAPQHAWDDLAASLAEVRDVYRSIHRQIKAYEPRYAGDRGAVDFQYVVAGDTLHPRVERERRAIEMFREAGAFHTLSLLCEDPLAIGARSYSGSLWPAHVLTIARAASMRLAADAGEFDEVARGFDEVLMLGRTISYQGPTSMHQTGNRVQGMVMTELCHELMEYEFPEAVCARLLESIRRRPLAPAELALECDRARLRDRIQIKFTDDGRGNGYRISPGAAPGSSSMKRFRNAFDRRFVHPSRRAERELCDATIDMALAELALPLYERRHTDAEDPAADGTDPYAVASDAIRDASWFLASEAYERRAYEATRLVIALALFRARHGRLPGTLDELVPDVLGELPVDPTTGASFAYLRLEDDPHHRPFVLYSRGRDGRDDGGTFDVDRPRRAREPGSEGLDEPLTLPRRAQRRR